MPDILVNMSNIGKKQIELKEGISAKVENGKVIVTGAKGVLETPLLRGILIDINDGKIKLRKEVDIDEYDKFFGLMRSLIANMVKGVSVGFERKLELSGVGYRAKTEGDFLVLNVGFAQPVRVKAPEGISIKVDENIITVLGIDKEKVGDVAANIRRVRPPDPYKGKGVKFLGEKIRRKAGKAVKTGAK